MFINKNNVKHNTHHRYRLGFNSDSDFMLADDDLVDDDHDRTDPLSAAVPSPLRRPYPYSSPCSYPCPCTFPFPFQAPSHYPVCTLHMEYLNSRRPCCSCPATPYSPGAVAVGRRTRRTPARVDEIQEAAGCCAGSCVRGSWGKIGVEAGGSENPYSCSCSQVNSRTYAPGWSCCVSDLEG